MKKTLSVVDQIIDLQKDIKRQRKICSKERKDFLK